MEDSERLRNAVNRARARDAARAPINEVVNRIAARQGVDLTRMNDPELGDRLLAEAERNARMERLARQADILLNRIPSEYRTADYPRATFGDEAREWVGHFREFRAAGKTPRSLVILGQAGTGKTWTAAAIAKTLLTEDTIPVTFISVSEMLAAIRPATGGLDVDMMQFAITPVLVLDDLGTEGLTPWVAEQLYRLSHERSHNGRPTITTSNLTGEEIKERYDRRTVERLFGGAMLIQIDGETRRTLPF